MRGDVTEDAEGSQWKWVNFILSLLGIAFLGSAAIESIYMPFGLDQGWFARVSDEILAGGLPYVDAWEVKSPATHYMYALSEILLGRSTASIRVLDLAMIVIGLVALSRLWRKQQPAASGLGLVVACLFFASFHLKLGFWDGAQPDPWAAICILCGVAWVEAADRRDARRLRGPAAFSAGMLIGLAGLFKLPYLAMGVPVAVASLRTGDDLREGFRSIAIICVGALTSLALACAGFAWQGGLSEMVEIQWGFNRLVHSAHIDLSPAHHLRSFAEIFSWATFAATLPFVLLAGVALRGQDRRRFWLWVSWVVTAVALLALQGRYYHYQKALLFAPLSILAGYGIAFGATRVRRWLSSAGRPTWQAELALLLSLLLVFAFAFPRIRTRAVRTYWFGSLPEERYLASFTPRVIWAPKHTYALAAELEKQSDVNDTIFVWGLAPAVHYLANRRAPSRFASSYPLIAGREAGFRERYRREFLEAISRNPPKLIAIATRDLNALYDETSWQHFVRFEAFRRFVETRYEHVEPVSNFRIFRLMKGRAVDADGMLSN